MFKNSPLFKDIKYMMVLIVIFYENRPKMCITQYA